jgi:hypothetical protein
MVCASPQNDGGAVMRGWLRGRQGYFIDVADICGDVALLWRDDEGLEGAACPATGFLQKAQLFL